MSFFKRLFGKNNPQSPPEKQDNQDNLNAAQQTGTAEDEPKEAAPENNAGQNSTKISTEQQFKEELYHSLQRYYATPGFEVELNLTDSNGITYQEHEAFDATFNEWKGIRSFWDRMGVFYDLWDKSELEKLAKWQVIQRYVNDRLPLKALEFFKTNITQEDYMDIRLPVALSKMNRSLDSLESAKYYAEASFKLRPDLDIVKVELATVLHLSDNQQDRERGHALMQEVLENKIKAYDGTQVTLLNFFLFGKEYIDSSIFAAMYLHVGNADLENWDIMADEYYYCPHFRYEHAIVLHRNNKTPHMLAKLDSLANEFPWFKKAVTTYMSTIASMRKSMNNPTFMQDEMAKMEQYKAMWKQ